MSRGPYARQLLTLTPFVLRLNTTAGVYALTATLTLAIWFPLGSYIPALFVVSIMLGGCIGSLISLAPVCVGQFCNVKDFGRWLGMCYCVASVLSVLRSHKHIVLC